MPENSVSSLIQVVLTLTIVGVLVYPLYPVVEGLNHAYGLFFVLAVALVLAAVVVKLADGSRGLGERKKAFGLIGTLLLFATLVVVTLAVVFLIGGTSLQLSVILDVVAIAVLLVLAMS
ncbi:MAG: hypothetical protein OK438_01990 [Thaumarchaeota archaeon]|nr:hypothetical protein [Nitrososphaerota archaeon]